MSVWQLQPGHHYYLPTACNLFRKVEECVLPLFSVLALQCIVSFHRGNPFPAAPLAPLPPLPELSPLPFPVLTPILAPGCLAKANLNGSSLPCPTIPPPLATAVPLPLPLPPTMGPLLSSSSRPRSRHVGSFFVCVARWMPNAACWSGTTSSSSSGFTGCRCGGM